MLEALVVAAMVLGLLGAFQVLGRPRSVTRAALVGATALTATVPMLLWLSGVALLRPEGFGIQPLPYALLAAGFGAVIGGTGLFARWLRSRHLRSRRRGCGLTWS